VDTQPGTIFGREPAMVLALVQAVIALVVAFGLNLAPDQIGAILAVTAVMWRSRSGPRRRLFGGGQTQEPMDPGWPHETALDAVERCRTFRRADLDRPHEVDLPSSATEPTAARRHDVLDPLGPIAERDRDHEPVGRPRDGDRGAIDAARAPAAMLDDRPERYQSATGQRHRERGGDPGDGTERVCHGFLGRGSMSARP